MAVIQRVWQVAALEHQSETLPSSGGRSAAHASVGRSCKATSLAVPDRLGLLAPLCRSRSGFLPVALVALCACGGGTAEVAQSPTAAAYAKKCNFNAGKQRFELAQNNYTPMALTVSDWPGHAETTLTEAQLVAALAKGDVKRAAIFARGGLGKTRLAESLRGQLCGQMPVFLVDAKAVAQSGAAGNPLLAAVQAETGPDVAAFVREVAQGRALFFVDGVDEVPVARRNIVLLAWQDAVQQLPQAQFILLARPPVLTADYGFTALDARLAIQPLQCRETDAFIAQTVKDATERGLFLQFLRRYGLDAQATAGGACSYPYLASFGDVKTLWDFHKKAADPKSDVIVSRARVHEALVGARLTKELRELGWNEAQALRLVDRLVRARLKQRETADPHFDFADCQAVVDEAAKTSDDNHEQVCEKLFQSALFRPVSGDKSVQFASAGLANLFLARWLDGEMAPANCQTALQHADLVRDDDVFRFLIAQPAGLKCVMPLLDDRCSRIKNLKADQVEILDAGLPIGKARPQIIQQMRAGYEATHWKLCVKNTLTSMEGTTSIP